MSHPPLIQTLSHTLRQPVWLATLASVGFHGLLWAVLPALPLSSQTAEPEEKRMVQLVELTPEEQSRVPQFSQPQSLSPSALSLPQGQPLPSPLTQPSAQPPAIDPSLLYPLPITPPPAMNLFPTPSRNEPRQEPKKKITAEKTDSEKSGTRTERTDNSRSPSKPQKPADSSPAKPGTTGSTQTTKTTPVLPDKIPQGAIAQLQQRQQEIRAMQDKGGYDPAHATKSDKEYLGNVQAFGDYYKELLKDIPAEKVAENIKQVNIPDYYPKDACAVSPEPKGGTYVGALFKPNGEIAGEPKILFYSPFKILNSAASTFVQGYKFNPGDKYQVVEFRFKFAPSQATCASNKPS